MEQIGQEQSEYLELNLYEQNNLNAFKQIFIEQFKFAVGEYFRVRVE